MMKVLLSKKKLILPPLNLNTHIPMKKVSIAMLAAGVIFLASCGGGADADKAKAAADSTRVADSLAAIAAKDQATLDSIAAASAEQARLDSIAAADASASKGGSKGGSSKGTTTKKEEPKKEEPVTNMKGAAGKAGDAPKSMKDAATDPKSSGAGAKSMKDAMKGK